MSESLSTIEQRVSYGLGRQLGEQLLQQPFELDHAAATRGLADVLAEIESAVSEDDLSEAFQALNRRIQEESAARAKTLAADGEAFLAENAKREEVTVTDSGLQYEVMVEGDGEKPGRDSTVRTHYHGTLIDGTVFDSSVRRGEPAEFPVGGVISGWTEALQLMGVGSKWKLFLPYQLAYGERGAGGAIGPYATLVFEVELLAIVD